MKAMTPKAILATAAAALLMSPACSSSNGGSTAGAGGSGSGKGGTSTTSSSTGGGAGSSLTGGSTGSGGTTGASGSGGTGPAGTGGAMPGTGGASSATGGRTGTGGGAGTGGTRATGGGPGGGGGANTAGALATGGRTGNGGGAGTAGASARTGGASGSPGTGGASGRGGASATGGGTGTSCAGPIGTFTGALATGINFIDDRGQRVNAHGGGIIKEGDTYYMHGEYFLSTTTDNNFNGFSMYSSRDLATWKWEKMVLPQQPSGLLGPKRKGERPHIIKCPSTGEFVLYAHAASEDYQTDKEVVYATSPTVNGDYTFVGALTNASGTTAAHSDMSAVTDGNNAYVITESGHVYTLAADCHSWVSDKSYGTVNGDSGGSESPTVFKAGSTYYWIGSYKTGWRANNNFYATAPAMTGPWTFQGFIAPVKDTSTTGGDPNPPEWISDERTWLSQSTWVTPVTGCSGTVYVFWGDHWYGNQDTSNPGKHNDQATYVFQPLVFDGTRISMPTYHETWKLDVGAGTWSP
jgi:hypothetical protein